ncbi:hypothetical protein RJ640_022989 [Escallonia rubra]|uniref:Cytochrome P450 n=1 Tax=Escallonia rubra TaxID=112253 RepID=A0AA88UK59_9ASTE|nr:hypothetical protein RJ640_022989 [Escallonia rubra]
MVRESDLSSLPYLEAWIKETLRLHPPGPVLIPHRAVQTCEVMGYTIPKDSEVMVNFWAIARDPTVWDDPLRYKPERFLASGLDYTGLMPVNAMDLTAFRGETNVFLPFFLLILTLFLFILKQIRYPPLKGQNLPPGPRPWPVIGNILHMGKKPHISLTHFAKLHGPLISMRLGNQLLVVGSTPAAATEILKTHDRVLSARYVPKASTPHLRPLSLAFASECSEYWKSLRSLCRTELFSAKAIELQAGLRERKVGEMVEFLEGKDGRSVKIGEVAFAAVFNILANICFSKDFIDLKGGGVDSGLKEVFWKMLELATTPNIADFYPIFDGLDPQGIAKKALEYQEEVFRKWELIIKERKESNGIGAPKQRDFLDVMLTCGFSDNQINNKEVIEKLRKELGREIGTADSVKESHLSRLPYLHACVKETLRLHPPVPFLLPHRSLETCEVMNYTIPFNTQVIVNVWAIGRDPTVWEDPLSFKPERFLDSEMDFRGQDFELLPFSAGRRMCPGLPLGIKQVHLIVATLIHRFEWLLPNDEDPLLLDMNEKFGITLQKEQPLLLIPKQK